jgi:hypothetical protein
LQFGQPASRIDVVGRILRCHVARLERDQIRYRGALAFEKRVPGWEDPTPLGSAHP